MKKSGEGQKERRKRRTWWAEKKQEILVEKLRRRGKRRYVGPLACTPVRLWTSAESEKEEPHQPIPSFLSSSTNNNYNNNNNNKNIQDNNKRRVFSARKLGAAIWEFQHYFLPLSQMHRGGGAYNGGGGDFRLRRHQNRHHAFKGKGIDLSHFLADPSPSSPDQPESAGSLRRHIAASLIQHHRLIERSNRALQPVSPASYGSSLEMAPYNPAVTPSSSLDFKGRIGESHYNLRTSTELLKVLNRIWSLEEQHVSNMALIKALKTELEHARVRIKELLRDQQRDRHEIDDLVKQIAEEKQVRKSKEQDRLQAAIQSLRDEMEDERNLRKRSESLHRKLARELSEMKSSLSSAVKEMEKERKSRKLLEDLCDEFARGIKNYEREVHAMRQKSDKDWAGRADGDRFILHLSESWLDERMQMKLDEAHHGFVEKNSIVEKLGFEIEAFLKSKRLGSSRANDSLLPREHRNLVESVPLNEVVSAPQDVGDEEDSAGSDSHCFELNKPSNGGLNIHDDDEAVDGLMDESVKSSRTKKKPASGERSRRQNPSNLQVKFEEQMAWATSCNGNKRAEEVKPGEGNPTEMSVSRKSEICDATEGGSLENNNKVDGIQVSNTNYVIDSLIRSHITSSDAGNMHLENDAGEASCSHPTRRNASPVRQWMTKLTNLDLDISEPSTKQPPSLKENTLKAKLLEARSKGRSRLKIFKGSS